MGPFVEHSVDASRDLGGVVVTPAIEERIRRDVNYGHEQCLAAGLSPIQRRGEASMHGNGLAERMTFGNSAGTVRAEFRAAPQSPVPFRVSNCAAGNRGLDRKRRGQLQGKSYT